MTVITEDEGEEGEKKQVELEGPHLSSTSGEQGFVDR